MSLRHRNDHCDNLQIYNVKQFKLFIQTEFYLELRQLRLNDSFTIVLFSNKTQNTKTQKIKNKKQKPGNPTNLKTLSIIFNRQCKESNHKEENKTKQKVKKIKKTYAFYKSLRLS